MVRTVESGKLAEFKVLAMLVKLGFSLFVPVVDTGVDAVAEWWADKPPTYYGVQVKSSSFISKYRSWAWNVDPKTFRVSESNFLILVLEDSDRLPEKVRLATRRAEAPDLYALVMPTEDFETYYALKSLRWPREEHTE